MRLSVFTVPFGIRFEFAYQLLKQIMGIMRLICCP